MNSYRGCKIRRSEYTSRWRKPVKQHRHPGQSKDTWCWARVPGRVQAPRVPICWGHRKHNEERQSMDQNVPGKTCFQSTDLAVWEELPETSLPVAIPPGRILEEARVCLNHSWVAQSVHWEEKLASWQPPRSLSLHGDVGSGICRRLFSTASGKRPKPEDNTEFPRANSTLSKKIKILHLSYVADQQVTQESTRECTELWSFPLWASPLPELVHNPRRSLSPDLQWTLQCAGWAGLALTVTGSEQCAAHSELWQSPRTFSGKEMPLGLMNLWPVHLSSSASSTWKEWRQHKRKQS